jgi:nucleoid-associated protein YgaU
MTREAKIGMLTGLGVIVLIGVLLSNYLGADGHGMSPTGRMAELPLGAAYRQEVMEPVGVPGVVRQESGVSAPVAAAAIPAGVPTMPEVAKGVTDASGAPAMGSGPMVGPAVAAVPAGTVQAAAGPSEMNVPTLQLAEGNGGQEAVYVAGQPKAAVPGLTFTKDVSGAVAAPVGGQEYVIVPGDTLGKIATKFYHSSKGEAVGRIVAANPKVLKDEKTMLVAGKKLMIPNVAAAAKGAPAVAVVAPVKKAPVVIHQPGGVGAVAAGSEEAKTIDAPVKKGATVYVVASGDTIEKIAKKLAPGHVSEMEKKLEAGNGIKDPTGLKVGQKLKVPAVG